MQTGCIGLIFTAVIAVTAVFVVSKSKKLNMR